MLGLLGVVGIIGMLLILGPHGKIFHLLPHLLKVHTMLGKGSCRDTRPLMQESEQYVLRSYVFTFQRLSFVLGILDGLNRPTGKSAPIAHNSNFSYAMA